MDITQVMGCKYLTALKNKFDDVKIEIHKASMIYKRIEWLFWDLSPSRKGVQDHGSCVHRLIIKESGFLVPSS